MKKEEKLSDAIGEIDDKTVREAELTRGARFLRRKKLLRGIAAACAVCVMAIGIGGMFGRMNTFAIALAEYPEMADYPNERNFLTFESAYDAWRADRMALRESRFDGYGDGLDAFTKEALPVLLSGAEGENRVCSPINVYMALSMLTELTAGESQLQLLSLLGGTDVEVQRKTAEALWKNNYSDDGATTLVLANSLWMDSRISFREEPVELLRSNYFASTYRGSFKSGRYTGEMKKWLNEQTGGLLKESVDGIEPDPETILTLLSTVYYRAKWADEFKKAHNEERIFHAPSGDVTETFMRRESPRAYYWGDTFAACALGIQNSGSMWLFLPDEGRSIDEMLADEGIYRVLTGTNENYKHLIVDLGIPKFDIASDSELSDSLKNLGITDIFDASAADFTPLIDDPAIESEAYISRVGHAARVAIDEEGITAAAYVEMAMAGAAEPPDERVEFILDRPFLFVITGTDGAPLFAGVVNQP